MSFIMSRSTAGGAKSNAATRPFVRLSVCPIRYVAAPYVRVKLPIGKEYGRVRYLVVFFKEEKCSRKMPLTAFQELFISGFT